MHAVPASALLTPRRQGRKLCGLFLSLFLLAQSALAFFPSPQILILFVNGPPGTIHVNGPAGGTKLVNITSISGHNSIATYTTPNGISGAGTVPVVFTGTAPGVASVFFYGTYGGQFVSGSAQIYVLGSIGTSAQNPQIAVGGDPINTGTGEYFGQEAVDLNMGGPMPVTFSRYVASNLATDGLNDAGLGQNRLHNYASKLLSVNATLKRVALPSGRVLTFLKNGAKWELQQPLDVPYALIESGSNFILGDPQTKQMWTYDSTGHLVKIEDGRGNVHNLSYTGSQLLNVNDGAFGHSLAFSYTSGKLVQVIGQPGDRTVTFDYTGNVLTSATDTNGKITTYGNNAGLPTTVTRPETNLLFTNTYTSAKVTTQVEGSSTSTLAYNPGSTTYTDPIGKTLVDSYDANGRLTSHADEAGKAITMTYDSAGRRTSVTDRLGDKTTTTYNPLNGLHATLTNAEGKVTTMTYKARTLNGITFQDLIKTTYPDGSSIARAYDAKGNVTQITDQAGKMWKYTWNANGQVLTATNPLGGVTTCTYDAHGNTATCKDSDTGLTSYEYDSKDRLHKVTHPDGAFLTIEYNARDRISSITDERSKTYTYAYDNNDRLTTLTDPGSNAASLAYDALDRVEKITDRLTYHTDTVFGPRHEIASIKDRNGFTTTFQYDDRQRVTSVTDPGSVAWTRTYDDEGQLLTFTTPGNSPNKLRRNHLGRVIEASDPVGGSTFLVRDAMQRVTQKLDPAGRQTLYAYDKAGRLASVTEQGTGIGKYDRDALGNISKITDPNGGAWAFTYLKSGRLASMVDPLGKKWLYAYDTSGRLSTVTPPDAATATNTYDAAGNVTAIQYLGGPNLTFSYDSLGRLDTASGLDFDYDQEGRVTNSKQSALDFGATYDNGGRLASVTFPGGAITVTYTYDSRNRLTGVTDTLTNATTSFSYDDAGRLISITRPSGVTGTYSYDGAGRLYRIQEGSILDLKYELNRVGEILSVDMTAHATPTVTAAPAQTFKFGKASQITTVGYAYDLRGRLTARPGATFTWDAASRLTNANGILLAYNGLGDIVSRTDGVNTTLYYHNYAIKRAPIVYEHPPSGAECAYIWTPDGRLLYSVNMDTHEASYYLFDRTGSTLAIVDHTGDVTDAYAYGPYGEPMPGRIGASPQPFTYIGQYGVRAEGSLYQMRARYYDPVTAQFLSRDPLPPRLLDVKSLNTYGYAARNPLRYIDPEGADEEPPVANALATALFFGSIFMPGEDETAPLTSWNNPSDWFGAAPTERNSAFPGGPAFPSIPDFNCKPPGCGAGTSASALLFPFITNQAGFDTGLAISNTAVDPFAFPGGPSFAGGVRVAAGDLNGDGRDDLFSGPSSGGGIFTTPDNTVGLGLTPNAFTGGGIRVAVGDISGDGAAEVIVKPGFGGGPTVSVLPPTSKPKGTPKNLSPEYQKFFQGTGPNADNVFIGTARLP